MPQYMSEAFDLGTQFGQHGRVSCRRLGRRRWNWTGRTLRRRCYLPMFVAFLGFPAYQAVDVALASDVLASAASASTYGKYKNLDVKNGFIMLFTVLIFTLVGSWVASLLPNQVMGGFSVVMTFLLGIKFTVRPVLATKEGMTSANPQTRAIQSVLCGVLVGFICGSIGTGGGMMLLPVLTSVLGYELKTAVGTSVFIMTFPALTGAVSHMVIGGIPDLFSLFMCVAATFVGVKGSAIFASKAAPETLSRITRRSTGRAGNKYDGSEVSLTLPRSGTGKNNWGPSLCLSANH